jgi:hypothetical protein
MLCSQNYYSQQLDINLPLLVNNSNVCFAITLPGSASGCDNAVHAHAPH